MKAVKALLQLLLVFTFAVTVLPVTAHASSSICDAVAGNLVSNCGFETDNLTGWTTGGNFEFTGVASGNLYDYTADSGSYFLYMGPVGPDGTLSQTLTTSDGTDYTFSFYLASVGDDPSDFSAYWDDTQLLSLTDPNSGAAYTLYWYSVTGTGSDTIQLDFRDNPAYIALDDISVAPSAPTPEPGSLSLLLFGFAATAAAGVGRRRLFARS